MAQEILVSINVNSGKAEARLGSVKKATDGAKASNDLYAKSFDELTQSELQALTAEQKLALQRKSTKLQVQELAAAQMRAAGANKSARAQAGLNNAILLETGRLASDASFGFTAIANNLSQVVTLTQSFIRTNGSAVESFRQLRDSLLGAGGVMIGIQLLISFLPRIIAYFSDSTKEVNKFQKAMDDATKSIDEQIARYENLTRAVEKYGNVGKLGADANMLLADSFSEFKRAMDAIEEGATLTVWSDNMFEEDKILSGVAAQDELRKKFGELLEVRRELAIVGERLSRVDEEGNLVLRQNTFERQTALTEELQLLRKKIRLEKLFDLETKKGAAKLDREATFELYETRLNDFDRYAQKARKKELSLVKRTAIQKLDLQKQFAIEELNLRARTALENEKVRYQEYILDLNLRKQSLLDRAKTEKQKAEIITEFTKAEADANRKYTKTIEDLGVQFEKTTDSILGSYSRMQEELEDQQRLDDLKMFADEAIKGIQDRIAFEQEYSRERSTQLQLEQKLLDSVFKQDLSNLNAKIANAKADGDAYEGLIQRKINLEKTYGEETKRIARETDDAVFASKLQLASSIADIMEESARLSKEGSDLQKALSLTAIAANTSVSMIQGFRLAQEASQGTGPAAPFVAAATYAAQIATLLSAVNQAKSILSSGDVSGIGSSVSVEAPAFNVVGASPLDLLMVDISSKLDKPIPTYLTAKGAIETLDEYYRNVRTGSNSN